MVFFIDLGTDLDSVFFKIPQIRILVWGKVPQIMLKNGGNGKS